MINLFLKKNVKRKRGAATLITAIILLTASTLIIMFAAHQSHMLQKITGNQNRNAQAFESAQAGLEFAINYLRQNATTITAGKSGGYILPYSDTNTSATLANGSTYTIAYSNPIANNYNIINVTSSGTSDDGSSIRVVSQQLALGSLLVDPTDISFSSKGTLTMGGNATITNTSGNTTVRSGSSVSLSGSAQTVLSSGTSSTAGNIQSDIQQNSASLSSMSQNDFFATYFGTTDTSVIQNQVANTYTNNTNTNYSSTLNGMTGTSIWITQTDGTTASLNGNTTVGSAANPVLLVVNGSFSMSGNVTIYGFIFVIGTTGLTTLTGNSAIYGGMATSDNTSMSGNVTLTYDSTVLNNLQNNSSMRYYAKVPGTWKDF